MYTKKISLLLLLAIITTSSCTNRFDQIMVESNKPKIESTLEPQPIKTPYKDEIPIPMSTINPTPTPNNNNIFDKKNYSLTSTEIQKVKDSNIINSHNTFGVNLYKEFIKEDSTQNIFMSPLSVSLALQMLYNGAEGITKDEMSKTLQISNFNLEEVNTLNKLLLKKLNNPAPDINLSVANSIWNDKSRITFNPEFKSNLENFFDAKASELDFSDPKSPDVINEWCSDKTNGKIPHVINKISPETLSYLINAIYFKSDWTEKFDVRETVERDFNLHDKTTKKHLLMSGFRDFRYYNQSTSYENGTYIDHSNKFEAIELTYGKDKNVGLYIFLPGLSLEKFYSELTNENLNNWFKKFYSVSGFVSIPKFKMKMERKLNNDLINLGIQSAFGDNANFSKMVNSSLGNISITNATQHSYIDVNEEGSEAAAVTVIESGSVSSAPTLRFVADRPFFYLIRDNDTESILFMGAVNDPTYE